MTNEQFPTISSDGADQPAPKQIARFRIERILGKGGFGVVYLCFDEQLQRQVAVKVPRLEFIKRAADRDLYLKEARVVASIQHPNIVPVYEIGSTPEFPIYIVSKFIDGNDLAMRLSRALPSQRQAVEWMIDLAGACREAHRQGFVHRDIKPQNILVDRQNHVHLADFGLALSDEDLGKRLPAGGTPAYMSPEQARGEGHRVDGRSDLFSLGIVFYEMLAGRKPFQGDSNIELMYQITEYDPKPLRQWDDSIAPELERICFKMLAKRKSERYSSATDLADDLRVLLSKTPANHQSPDLKRSEEHEQTLAPSSSQTAAANDLLSNTAAARAPMPASRGEALKIVPQGLRSFNHRDADFFLELLPGARDRDGLPESIAFWKSRIEERDADQTFAVGLVYGPSGCGKSSMVKAGLLPKLSADVMSIYLEASSDDTERTLLSMLRKKLDAVKSESSTRLVDVLQEIRRGRILPRGKKLLIVIDQFEQWLFSHPQTAGQPLLDALLQCDGARVQCIVMVRDDFWMAATRFFHDLDIPLLERVNSAAVDLFDLNHAQRVLRAFGKAFGKLDSHENQDHQAQNQFIADAVLGMAEQGKVISVRLALFAEMMKSRPWTPRSLREVGGTTGVGTTFLEETFSASGAPPQHRYHQQAARLVLRSLLPEAGTDIKGNKRSNEELKAACFYGGRQRDFNELIRILDGELRLITPVDNTQMEDDGAVLISNTPSAEQEEPASKQSLTTQYQLTHDYLVPSLRDWLTRKQRESRTGRAELKLAERTAAWNALRENKQLPTLGEWINIRTLTDRKRWTNPERMLMQQANGFHLRQLTTAVLLSLLLIVAGLWTLAREAKLQEATRIEGLVGSLVTAEPTQLTDIIRELDANPQVAASYLSPLVSTAATTLDEKRAQLHARLALVSRDATLLEPLVEELLTGKVTYVAPISQQLRPAAEQLTERFEVLLSDEKIDAQRRFRAALALANYVPESKTALWTEPATKFIAQQLVASNPEFQPLLRDLLRPIQARLLTDIERIFVDPKATDVERLGTANAFADYAKTDIEKLSHLLSMATPEQFAVLYPIVAVARASSTVDDLRRIAATLPADELGSAERIVFGQHRANAAVTLLRLGARDQVLPVFEMIDDPEALTQFVFRCRSRGVLVDELLELLEMVRQRVSLKPIATHQSPAGATGFDKSYAHYAILLAMGEYALDEVPPPRRESLLKELADTYRNDPSSGVHGAAGWLLRKWGQSEVVREVDHTAIPYSTEREWFTLSITAMPTPASEAITEPISPKNFYYTFCVFPAGDYLIGSVPDEANREKKDESRHEVKLTRPFALLNREVTMAELIAFSPKDWLQHAQSDVQPEVSGFEVSGFSVNWYDAVAYCRWLTLQAGMDEGHQAYADPTKLDKAQYPRELDPRNSWAPRNWQLQQTQPGFRLMTEAEWEVASRAGCRTTFAHGSEEGLMNRFAWFADNCGNHVHPPCELRPSIKGLFDIHGNVAEWTHDWFLNTEGTTVDPVGADNGSYRVVRGGGWRHIPAYCRSSSRSRYDPSNSNDYFGIRLAVSLEVEGHDAATEK
ncbi:MAG: SUMF1/EgtB/PvdO family nonheme iron enzyme [Pirellulaceae bacterium]|nr:SUMF1/EgtB/PvdO family nonheme iron enzyme [Pirellulaceae bacterium]